MNNKMLSLSGIWKIAKDADNTGKEKQWQNIIPKEDVFDITVPERIPNSEWVMDLSYSNIFPKYNGYVWYYKRFNCDFKLKKNEKVRIEFENAVYLCVVYLNGEYIGEHRHQENGFWLDVTDQLKKNGENLLVVRCYEPRPVGKEIDGIKLADLPNSCWAQKDAFAWGSDDTFCLECVGGLLGYVHLRIVSEITVEDLYINSCAENGNVDISVTVLNISKCSQRKNISIVLTDKKSGTVVGNIDDTFELPVGASEITLSGKIENHQLWELDSPVLYLATVHIDKKAQKTSQFGFKDFRIKNGFFFLNGKRIFIKGAHVTPCTAYAISMKALGFNMIRTISRRFSEELLNVCDEIGLLVMDAAATAWGMFLHNNTRSQIEEYNVEMIKASRNHPSVAAYCLFNETRDQKILFNYGVQALPLFRKYAPNTLFLLHSGRWDCDISLGSASNPGSNKWDTFLGAEGILNYPTRKLPIPYDGCLDYAMGHIHVYMHTPVSSEIIAHLRKIGSDVAPIFIGESGIASQCDPMGEFLSNYGKKLSGALTVETPKDVWEKTEELLDFYDLKHIYPCAFDLSRAADKLNGAQRTLLYNIYRSNPKINGFSLTSFSVGNEGILQGKLVIKDSLAYALQQGHEPLRWSLFSSERCVYANKPFEIEAVLCNEDVLEPGTYMAKAYITGKDGCVWKKDFAINYPEKGYGGMPPLAFSALKESVCLPVGEYVFSARLMQGGVAYDGDLNITVAEADNQISAKVTVWGVSNEVIAFLKRHGISVNEFDNKTILKCDKTILIGCPETIENSEKINELAKKGANIIFIDPSFFEKNEHILKKIAGENAHVQHVKNTIYHNDIINVANPVFSGINNAGINDLSKLGKVYPDILFHSVDKPTKTICASIRIESSYTLSGLIIGEYAIENGKYILNAFHLQKLIGKHPYADMLLINFVKSYF